MEIRGKGTRRKVNLSSSPNNLNAQTRILAGEQNDHTQFELFCTSFRKHLQDHGCSVFTAKAYRPTGRDTFLFLWYSVLSRLLTAGISLPWLWKAKSGVFCWLGMAKSMQRDRRRTFCEACLHQVQRRKKYIDDFYTRILLTLFYPACNCKWVVRLILQQQIFPMNSKELMFQLCLI